MIIAIASQGNSLHSKIDAHFGRCTYFVLYNTENRDLQFIENPFRQNEDGAGTAAVQWMASQQVKKIISGEIGMKIKPLLDSLKIQMIILKDSKKEIQEIIDLLNHA